MPCKALLWGRLPSMMSVRFDIISLGAVIVNNSLCLLPVALTGCEYSGSGLFKHRDEVRNNNSLRVEVFRRTKEVGTLEAPAAFLVVIVTSMACPESDMAILQSVGVLDRRRNILYPGLSLVFDVAPQTGLISILRQSVRNEFVNCHTVGDNRDVVVSVDLGQFTFHLFIYMFRYLGGEFLRGKKLIGSDGQGTLVIV